MSTSSLSVRYPVLRRIRNRKRLSFNSRSAIRSFARKSRRLDPSSASSRFAAAFTAFALAVQFLHDLNDIAGEEHRSTRLARLPGIWDLDLGIWDLISLAAMRRTSLT